MAKLGGEVISQICPRNPDRSQVLVTEKCGGFYKPSLPGKRVPGALGSATVQQERGCGSLVGSEPVLAWYLH